MPRCWERCSAKGPCSAVLFDGVECVHQFMVPLETHHCIQTFSKLLVCDRAVLVVEEVCLGLYLIVYLEKELCSCTRLVHRHQNRRWKVRFGDEFIENCVVCSEIPC